MKIRGANHIGYSRSQNGKTTFRSLDPVTGRESETVFHQASAEEVDQALELAAKAFPVFSALSHVIRAEFLETIAERLEAHTDELIASFVTESGLPADRAHTELTRTRKQLTTFAEALRNGFALNAIIDPADPERKPAPKPDLRKVNTALGPVVVFGASNFPFAYSTIGGDSASALAAGCPVLLKAHPMHPQTSELVAELIVETAKAMHLPEGVFSHLHAIDFAVAEQLVKDERVKAVGFTGSFKGGMALHKMAQERYEPIPVFAEMGSINPIVVLPEAAAARTETIAATIAQSIALNAGQFCTSPGLVFVLKNADSKALIAHLTHLLNAVPLQTMLHPGIKKNYAAARDAQRPKAEILLAKDDGEETLKNGIYPALFTISGKQFLSEANRQEEVFGSYALVIECGSVTEMNACIASLNGQLTASLFFETSEAETAQEYATVLGRKVGRMIFNGVPTGVEVSPAMHHGGTFPATTDSRFTAVGASAIARFMRPVSYQNCPDGLLPEALKSANPTGILRFVNGSWTEKHC